jgi:hypothetical protein
MVARVDFCVCVIQSGGCAKGSSPLFALPGLHPVLPAGAAAWVHVWLIVCVYYTGRCAPQRTGPASLLNLLPKYSELHHTLISPIVCVSVRARRKYATEHQWPLSPKPLVSNHIHIA